MAVTFDLPDEVVARLRDEAERRGLTLDELIVEVAESFADRNDDVRTPRLGFVASGASASGITDRIDDILADGFERT